jgi:choline-sulfatase
MEKRRRHLLLALAAVAILAAAGSLVILRSGSGGTDSLPARSVAHPNLVVVTIASLRADRVGRGLMPAIDGLAARGLSFANGRTVAPLTLPAHVSLMTGLFPARHGVRLDGTGRFDGAHPTLAHMLRDSGYRTAAFLGAQALDRRFGLADGFDVYDDQIGGEANADSDLEAERPANSVADRAIEWLQKAAPDHSFFAWLHFHDPHAPYHPPAEFLQRAHGQPYDGEVAFADAQLARILDALRKGGHAADTVVVVVGDHGESLGEHGEPTHGMLVFEPVLRVPIVLAGPGVPVAQRLDGASLVDVLPTVLQLLGKPAPASLPGADLLKRDRRGTDLYAETEYPRVAGWSPAYSLVEGRWKLIQSPDNKLFDLETDPNEQRDVANDHAQMVTAMAARIEQIKSTAAEGAAGVPSDVAARLRSLGYVASTSLPGLASSAPDPAVVIDAWRSYEDAQAAALARDYTRALPLLERLTRTHPESVVFESGYVNTLRLSGNARAAFAAAREAVSRHAGDPGLFHALASAARAAGVPDEAMRAEQAVLTLAPDDPAAHHGLGLLAMDAHRFAEAATAFGRATTLDPNNARYWTDLGNANRDAGNRAAAAQAYRQAEVLEGRKQKEDGRR